MDYTKMSKEELQKHLDKVRIDLEEAEEERLFVLSQTGLHVSGGTVKKYEAECNSLREKCSAIEEALKK